MLLLQNKATVWELNWANCIILKLSVREEIFSVVGSITQCNRDMINTGVKDCKINSS